MNHLKILLLKLQQTTVTTSTTENPLGIKTISSFETTDINGNTFTNDIFKNHDITMINVWGTFCGPCIKEMPDLEKLYTEYKGEDFNLIGIVVDVPSLDDIDAALNIVDETKVTYPSLLMDQNLYTDIVSKFDFIPFTVFVDSEGNILNYVVEGSRDYDYYKSQIDSILAERDGN